MKNYFNVEKSKFHHGEYVGYSDGAWHIQKHGKGWKATKIENLFSIVGKSLEDISYQLYKMLHNPIN
jgi:hypothetical protein